MAVEVLQLFFLTSFKINVILLIIKNARDSEIFEKALFPSSVFKKMLWIDFISSKYTVQVSNMINWALLLTSMYDF